MPSICVWVYARTEDVSFVSNARADEYYSNANAEFPLLTGLACTPVYLAWLLPVQGRILLYSVHTQRNAYMQNHTLIYMRAQENWYFLRDPTHGHTHTHWESFWRAFEAAWLECACVLGQVGRGSLWSFCLQKSKHERKQSVGSLNTEGHCLTVCLSLSLSLVEECQASQGKMLIRSGPDRNYFCMQYIIHWIHYFTEDSLFKWWTQWHWNHVSNRVSAGASWHFTNAPLLMHC